MVSRRLLVRLLKRLERSFLPAGDRVRLQLERELLELLVAEQQRADGRAGVA